MVGLVGDAFRSKEHFQEILMILAQVGFALAAKEMDIAEDLQHFEPIEVRHSDIQEDQVWFPTPYRDHTFHRRLKFPQYLYVFCTVLFEVRL